MALLLGASDIWIKARAVLLSPEAASAAVFDVGTGVRLPFSDLAQQVLHLQALIQSWLGNGYDSDHGSYRALSPAEAVPYQQGGVSGPLEAMKHLRGSEARKLNDMAMQDANDGGGGTGRVGCLSGASVASWTPTLVAVFCQASLDYIRMVLAVLATGAAFLPLDPSWPPSRVAAVVRLARPALLLSNTANQHLLPPELLHGPYRVCVVPPPPVPPPVPLQQQEQGQGHPDLRPPVKGWRPEGEFLAVAITNRDDCSDIQRRRCAVRGRAMPYFAVLYTSGSTGEPLGVCMSESAWLKRISWMQRRYPLRPPGTQPAIQAMPQLSSMPNQRPGTLAPRDVRSPGDTGPQVTSKSDPSKSDNGISVGWGESACDSDSGGVDGNRGGGDPGSVVCFSTAVSFVDHLWQLLAPILAPSCGGESGGVDREELPIQAVTSVGKPVSAFASTAKAQEPTAVGAVRPVGPCSVVIPPPGAVLQPELFVGLLAEHGVSHLVSVPSLLRHLLPALRASRHRLGRLRLLVSSGEPLAVDLAANLSKALPDGARLLNLYGCTEVTADCTWFELERGSVLQAAGVTARGRKLQQQDVGKKAQDCDTDEDAADTAGSGVDTTGEPAACQSSGGGEWVAAASASAWVPAGWPIGDTQILIAAPQEDMDNDTRLDDEPGVSGGCDVGKEGHVVARSGGGSLGWPDGTGLVSTAGSGAATAASVTPLPLGSVGEVWVGGSCLSAGYYTPPASSRECDDEGDSNARREGAVGPAGEFNQAIKKGACNHRPVATTRFRRLRLTADQATCVLTANGLAPLRDATYFRTGDLGFLTSSGCLQLFGRVDRQIKVAGHRLDLEEVEALLAVHPLVREVAVVRWAEVMAPLSHRASGHHGGLRRPLLVETAMAAVEVTTTEEFEGIDQGKKQIDPREAGETGKKGMKLFPMRSQQLDEPPVPAHESPELLAYVVIARAPEDAVEAAAAAALGAAGASASGSITRDPYGPVPVPEAVAAGLRTWLSQRLALRGGLRLQFLSLSQLPRNPAGKLMRRQLPPPPLLSPQPAAEYWGLRPSETQLQLNATSRHHRQLRPVGVDSPSEMAVMRAIVTATGLTGLEATTDIFSAGMSSLEAVQVAALLSTDVRMVLSYPTPRTLAAALRAAAENAGSSSTGSGARGGGGSTGPPPKRPRLERSCLQPLTAPLIPSAVSKPLSAAVMDKSVDGFVGGSSAEGALWTHGTVGDIAAVSSAVATGVLGGAGEAASRFKEAVRTCRKLRWQRGGDGGGGVGKDGPLDEGTGGGEGSFYAAAAAEEEEAKEEEESTAVPAVPVLDTPRAPRGLRGRWRYRLGRCVDAPVLHVSLDSDLALDCRDEYCNKDVTERDCNRQQQRQPAACAPAPQQLGLPSGENPPLHHLCAIVACSHDGDVACLDEATGVPYWHVRLPARAEAGLAIAWGFNSRSGCCDTGADAQLITPPRVRTILDVAAGGGTATPSFNPAGEVSAGVKKRQDADAGQGNVSFAPVCINAPASGRDLDTRRRSSATDASSFRTALAPRPQHQPCLMPYVIAACGNGVLYSLDLADGSMRGAVDCGGEFKSPPVCDPWVGAIWATGHSRQLIVMRPPDSELGRIHLGAPMSVSAAFASIRQPPPTHDGPKVATTLESTHAEQDGAASRQGDATISATATADPWLSPACVSIPVGSDAVHHARKQQQEQQEQHVRLTPAAPFLRMALVATLDGRTHAIRVDIIETGKTSPQPAQVLRARPGPRCHGHSGRTTYSGWDNSSTPPRPLQLRLSRLWSLDGPAPVFSALLVLPGVPPPRDRGVQDPHLDGGATAIVGHVVGSVRAFQLEAGLHPVGPCRWVLGERGRAGKVD
ncbi:hypothetical protein Vretimale_15759 [Volvox reticuliferus]|uniref:AMP-dependent synthetase/ligase domain-containing protein n=2 Tax=Volvox reticuliferus TaxID=1737510 RepID=A0A8J4GSH7_9CHLO|nr:hypothetical protein Vretimale_15759 [Volvox reticuliferus]